MKEAIEAITSLCSVGDHPGQKMVKYRDMEELTSIKKDPQALLINTIINLVVRYVAYDITYKIHFRNHEGSTSAIVVFLAHMMVKENKQFDLCSLMMENLIENFRMSLVKSYPF